MNYLIVFFLAFNLMSPLCAQEIEHNKGGHVSSDELDDGLPRLKSLPIRQRAMLGDCVAQSQLGDMYRDVGRDSDAFKWYDLSAVQGYAPAQFNLAILVARYQGNGSHTGDSKYLLALAAKQGLGPAQQELGLTLFYEQFVDGSLDEAIYWLERAAVQNQRYAAESLLSAKMRDAYLPLARKGDANAQNNLGELFAKNANLLRDARKWYLQAAAGGSTASMFHLGEMAENGEATPQNYKEAFSSYLQAAEMGHAEAARKVADMYSSGRGVDKDDVIAAKWLQIASERGDELSKIQFGQRLEEGRGIEQDYKRAAALYRVVVPSKTPFLRTYAQFLYGNLFYQGKGVEKDLIKAYAWFDLASESANTDARLNRSQLRETLAPTDLEKAKAMALECKQSDFTDCD